jgi:hypothetical protein
MAENRENNCGELTYSHDFSRGSMSEPSSVMVMPVMLALYASMAMVHSLILQRPLKLVLMPV